MIVFAARPCKCWHWMPAVAPNAVPLSRHWPLFPTVAGILASRMLRCDVGLWAGEEAGEEAGLELVLAGGPEVWDWAGGAALAGNGARCATAATPRYPATRAMAAAIPTVLRLSPLDRCDRRPVPWLPGSGSGKPGSPSGTPPGALPHRLPPPEPPVPGVPPYAPDAPGPPGAWPLPYDPAPYPP